MELVNSPVEEYGQILDIDTDNTKPVSDSDVKAFLLKSKGIANPLIIQSLEKTRRNEMLISALSIGAGNPSDLNAYRCILWCHSKTTKMIRRTDPMIS